MDCAHLLIECWSNPHPPVQNCHHALEDIEMGHLEIYEINIENPREQVCILFENFSVDLMIHFDNIGP